MRTLLIILIALLFAAYVKKSAQAQPEAPHQTSMEKNKPGRVTGIGGIFFKCKDTGKMREWYNKNLGLVTNEYGSVFEFRSTNNPEQKNFLQWSVFSEKTKYFEPSEKDLMINYRVENMEALVSELKKSGVQVVDSIASYDYGKFVHIMDPEGNKIELWEPVDSVYAKMSDGKTTH